MAATAETRVDGTLALLDTLPVSGADADTVAANFGIPHDRVLEDLQRATNQGLADAEDGIYRLTDAGRERLS